MGWDGVARACFRLLVIRPLTTRPYGGGGEEGEYQAHWEGYHAGRGKEVSGVVTSQDDASKSGGGVGPAIFYDAARLNGHSSIARINQPIIVLGDGTYIFFITDR